VWDDFEPGASGYDDSNAIATDKQALLPGQTASFVNVTGYSKGMNGVIVDLAGRPADDALAANDFAFRMGAAADPSGWAAAPAPSDVGLFRHRGAGGSDRVFITFADGAVRNAWLQVTILPTPRTGLAAPEVFYFGNVAGETGGGVGGLRVNALDLGAVKRALDTDSAITGRFDLNRDGRVDAQDLAAVRQNLNWGLGVIAPPAPAAHEPTRSHLSTPMTRPATARVKRRVWDTPLIDPFAP
jgi:hypothetical protein